MTAAHGNQYMSRMELRFHMTTKIIIGDARKEVANLEPLSVGCVMTSPPYNQ
jgi:DNA modification methylase